MVRELPWKGLITPSSGFPSPSRSIRTESLVGTFRTWVTVQSAPRTAGGSKMKLPCSQPTRAASCPPWENFEKPWFCSMPPLMSFSSSGWSSSSADRSFGSSAPKQAPGNLQSFLNSWPVFRQHTMM